MSNGVTRQEIPLAEEHPFAYFRAASIYLDGQPPWKRDDKATRDVLSLTGQGACVPLNAIQNWTDWQCQQAEAWAGAVHLHASDNDDVFVPTIPPHVETWDTEENRERVRRESEAFWGRGLA